MVKKKNPPNETEEGRGLWSQGDVCEREGSSMRGGIPRGVEEWGLVKELVNECGDQRPEVSGRDGRMEARRSVQS